MSEVINGDAGRIGFLLKGDYDEDTTYNFLDVVYSVGASYVAKKETRGNIPSENSEFWQILARGGAEGDFASKAIYGDNAISLGRKVESNVGGKSISFGTNNEASNLHAVSIGSNNIASGDTSFSAGWKNRSFGLASASFGNNNVSVDDYSFSGGCGNIVLGYGSHVEGAQNISGARYILKIASYNSTEKTFTFDDTYIGFSESFAQLSEGVMLHIANVNYVDIASIYTVASVGSDGKSVVVNESIPTSNFSVLYAALVKPGVNYAGCHAEGRKNAVLAFYGHAEGRENIVIGMFGHAAGYHTKALFNQHSQGHYNDTSLASATTNASGSSSGTAFVIGNGTSSVPSNAARIDYNGKLWCKQAYSSTGADYAELFEWADGNPKNEDRRGYFVTVEEKKIKKAHSGDYILGIISGNPSVIGNSDMEWYGQFMRDEFGSFIKENCKETIMDPSFDEEGNPIDVEKEVDVEFYKVNPDYDPNAPYTFRLDRPEWDAVGMVGVLPVRDDGTCEVGKFCRCVDSGIATLAEERGFDTYMVIDRVTENIVSVILK